MFKRRFINIRSAHILKQIIMSRNSRKFSFPVPAFAPRHGPEYAYTQVIPGLLTEEEINEMKKSNPDAFLPRFYDKVKEENEKHYSKVPKYSDGNMLHSSLFQSKFVQALAYRGISYEDCQKSGMTDKQMFDLWKKKINWWNFIGGWIKIAINYTKNI